MNHRLTIKTGYLSSKIEEGNIAEDADTEDLEILSWSNPNTLELIEAIDARAAAQEEFSKKENANLRSKLAQAEKEKKQM